MSPDSPAPLHLMKLCVGIATLADLRARVAERLRQGENGTAHVTRMVPKRAAECLAGGSLFWVVRGQMAARQRLVAIEPFTDSDGVGRCRLHLQGEVVPVLGRRFRPFQGWRYLAEEDRPPDLDGGSGTAELPEALRAALRELCLL